MIRPAKCHFKGFIKAFIKGADKNHNPRKGTETAVIAGTAVFFFEVDKNHNPRKGTETYGCPTFRAKVCNTIRTIIPVRGRKQSVPSLFK